MIRIKYIPKKNTYIKIEDNKLIECSYKEATTFRSTNDVMTAIIPVLSKINTYWNYEHLLSFFEKFFSFELTPMTKHFRKARIVFYLHPLYKAFSSWEIYNRHTNFSYQNIDVDKYDDKLRSIYNYKMDQNRKEFLNRLNHLEDLKKKYRLIKQFRIRKFKLTENEINRKYKSVEDEIKKQKKTEIDQLFSITSSNKHCNEDLSNILRDAGFGNKDECFEAVRNIKDYTNLDLWEEI